MAYSNRITFTVNDVPIAKRDGQSRTFLSGGKPIVLRYTPSRLRYWQQRIADVARTLVSPPHGKQIELPLFPDGPVVLWVQFYFTRPKSVRASVEMKHTRPDADRLQCAVQDALQGIFYRCDSQIAEWHGEKRYTAAYPHAIISVAQITLD